MRTVKIREIAAALFLALVPNTGFAGPTAPSPVHGAILSNPMVQFCFPAAITGEVAKRFSIFEVYTIAGQTKKPKKAIYSTLVTTSCHTVNLSGLGSSSFEWRFAPLNSSGAVITPAGSPYLRSYSFKLSGQGLNLSYLPNRNLRKNTALSFIAGTDSSSGSAQTGLALTAQLSHGKQRQQCVNNRMLMLMKRPQVIGLSETKKRKEAKYRRNLAKAQEFCKQQVAESSDASAFGDSGDTGLPAIFALACFNPSNAAPTACPAGMTLEASSGLFNFTSPVEGDILVKITRTQGTFSDWQYFRLRVHAVATSRIITKLIGTESDPTRLVHAAHSPSSQDTVTDAGATPKLMEARFAVDGDIQSGEVWVPTTADVTDADGWSVIIQVNSASPQQMYWVDQVYINFFEMIGGTRIPQTGFSCGAAPLPACELTLSYSTKFNTTDSGFATSFVPLATTTMIPEGFAEFACWGGIVDDTCEGKVDVRKDATFIKISGKGARPAIEEVIISGIDGETDCAPGDPLKWRTWAYLDTNRDCRADNPTTPTLAQTQCYGAANTIPCGFIAPENLNLTPTTCACKVNTGCTGHHL